MSYELDDVGLTHYDELFVNQSGYWNSKLGDTRSDKSNGREASRGRDGWPTVASSPTPPPKRIQFERFSEEGDNTAPRRALQGNADRWRCRTAAEMLPAVQTDPYISMWDGRK